MDEPSPGCIILYQACSSSCRCLNPRWHEAELWGLQACKDELVVQGHARVVVVLARSTCKYQVAGFVIRSCRPGCMGFVLGLQCAWLFFVWFALHLFHSQLHDTTGSGMGCGTVQYWPTVSVCAVRLLGAGCALWGCAYKSRDPGRKWMGISAGSTGVACLVMSMGYVASFY